MSAKKKMPPESGYEYVKAIIDCDRLSWEYQVVNAQVVGRMDHDEDVSDWSDQDIRKVTCGMLDLDETYMDAIEIAYC